MKERLDVLLVKRNLAESREKAKAIIMSGNVFVNGNREDKAGTTFEYGGVWRGFDLAVRDRGENIELMFSTAFTSLIQNLETKEVKGVVAKGADGKEIRIKANKGVLLACGGYENNLQMQRDFHGMA